MLSYACYWMTLACNTSTKSCCEAKLWAMEKLRTNRPRFIFSWPVQTQRKCKKRKIFYHNSETLHLRVRDETLWSVHGSKPHTFTGKCFLVPVRSMWKTTALLLTDKQNSALQVVRCSFNDQGHKKVSWTRLFSDVISWSKQTNSWPPQNEKKQL